MKRIKSKQPLDCVEMKRHAQAKIYADTKGLSMAGQIAYFHRQAESGALGVWWKRISKLIDHPLAVREKSGKYGK